MCRKRHRQRAVYTAAADGGEKCGLELEARSLEPIADRPGQPLGRVRGVAEEERRLDQFELREAEVASRVTEEVGACVGGRRVDQSEDAHGQGALLRRQGDRLVPCAKVVLHPVVARNRCLADGMGQLTLDEDGGQLSLLFDAGQIRLEQRVLAFEQPIEMGLGGLAARTACR